jgi:DNA-binding CsgD family transcriptional regulator
MLTDRPAGPLHGEMLASRAVALACGGHSNRALEVAEQAEDASSSALMVQVLGPAIRAICSRDRKRKAELTQAAWNAANRLGNFDSIVVAYRGYPPLLAGFRSAGAGAILRLVESANDLHLANKYGLSGPQGRRRGGVLTAREVQVLDLVAAGASNQAVAKALYISESTVKAHLRHIYEKLGARSRADAVALWITRQ